MEGYQAKGSPDAAEPCEDKVEALSTEWEGRQRGGGPDCSGAWHNLCQVIGLSS